MQTQLSRLSAKRNLKLVNFYCEAPNAQTVYLIGDFTDWEEGAIPMERGPDGTWRVTVELPHGHHRYLFVVDGEPVLDPKAYGVGQHERFGRVSIVAVSGF